MKTTVWILDPSHSEVQFQVRHLTIANVTGRFNEVEGIINASDESFENAKFEFTANVNSIFTHDEKRDAHLKSADFFEAEKFPKLSFSSTNFKKINNTDFELIGNLTIRDITKPISLKVKYGGIAKDPWGGPKAGFEITGKISRKDYGLVWNVAIEKGGWLVSDEVTIIANTEFKIES